jgi:hypothetical protein
MSGRRVELSSVTRIPVMIEDDFLIEIIKSRHLRLLGS